MVAEWQIKQKTLFLYGDAPKASLTDRPIKPY